MNGNIFNIEELEIIRMLSGDKMKILKNRIQQYQTDLKISEEKRPKYLEKANQEFALIALIEAKAMKLISEKTLG